MTNTQFTPAHKLSTIQYGLFMDVNAYKWTISNWLNCAKSTKLLALIQFGLINGYSSESSWHYLRNIEVLFKWKILLYQLVYMRKF